MILGRCPHFLRLLKSLNFELSGKCGGSKLQSIGTVSPLILVEVSGVPQNRSGCLEESHVGCLLDLGALFLYQILIIGHTLLA